MCLDRFAEIESVGSWVIGLTAFRFAIRALPMGLAAAVAMLDNELK